VSEKMRDLNPDIDLFISQMKLLLKALKLQKQFKEKTSLPLPPKVCLTRWGTWLNTTFFYIENFDKIRLFINSTKCNNSYFTKVQNLIKSEGFEEILLDLYQYKFIPQFITKLQNTQLKSKESYEMIKEVEKRLSGPPLKKLKDSLNKNPDIEKFTSDGNTFDFKFRTRFAPLVSVDVERSFSMTKRILSDKPHMKVETLKKILCNSL
jgi:hypothetical protein